MFNHHTKIPCLFKERKTQFDLIGKDYYHDTPNKIDSCIHVPANPSDISNENQFMLNNKRSRDNCKSPKKFVYHEHVSAKRKIKTSHMGHQPAFRFTKETKTILAQLLPSINKSNTKVTSKMIKNDTFNLSQKTLEMMNFIKKTPLDNQKEEEDEELKTRFNTIDQYSLRFKYEELLQETRELPLPIKYKEILLTFCNLDIWINKLKAKTNHCAELITINSIDDIQNINYDFTLTFDSLKKILSLVPQLFVVESINGIVYIDIPKDYIERMTESINKPYFLKLLSDLIRIKDHNEISLTIPLTQQELDNRKGFMKQTLLDKVNQAHNQFLSEKLNQKPEDFNPFALRTWHHEFCLTNDVPDLSILDIVVFKKEFIEELKDIFLKENSDFIQIKYLIKKLHLVSSLKNHSKDDLHQMILKAAEDYPQMISITEQSIFGLCVKVTLN